MPDLSESLSRRCFDVLLKCSEFDSDNLVRSLFVTSDLAPFRARLPNATNKVERVTVVLEYLLLQDPVLEQALLVTFLRTLSSHYQRGNALLVELESLACDIQNELERTCLSIGASQRQYASQPSITVSLLTEVLPTAYCYQLTEETFPLVDVAVNNDVNRVDDVTVRLRVEIDGYSDPAMRLHTVSGGTKSHIRILPLLRNKAVVSLTEMRPASLHVFVEETAPGSRVLYEQTRNIRLHALDTALLAVRRNDGSTIDLVDFLAAWVTPRSLAVKHCLRRAAEHHPRKVIIGYQGARTHDEKVNIVREQAQAIFAELKNGVKLTYINSTLNMGRESGQVTQRVRLPSESLETGGSANCIDGAVLFASLLELASLDPLLVIVPGHAFVGWRIWRGSEQYEFAETTMIGTSDFVSAQREGQRQYDAALKSGYFTRDLFDPNGFARLIDIAACRAAGIMPLD